jgi:hypothetical protein
MADALPVGLTVPIAIKQLAALALQDMTSRQTAALVRQATIGTPHIVSAIRVKQAAKHVLPAITAHPALKITSIKMAYVSTKEARLLLWTAAKWAFSSYWARSSVEFSELLYLSTSYIGAFSSSQWAGSKRTPRIQFRII